MVVGHALLYDVSTKEENPEGWPAGVLSLPPHNQGCETYGWRLGCDPTPESVPPRSKIENSDSVALPDKVFSLARWANSAGVAAALQQWCYRTEIARLPVNSDVLINFTLYRHSLLAHDLPISPGVSQRRSVVQERRVFCPRLAAP